MSDGSVGVIRLGSAVAGRVRLAPRVPTGPGQDLAGPGRAGRVTAAGQSDAQSRHAEHHCLRVVTDPLCPALPCTALLCPETTTSKC